MRVACQFGWNNRRDIYENMSVGIKGTEWCERVCRGYLEGFRILLWPISGQDFFLPFSVIFLSLFYPLFQLVLTFSLFPGGLRTPLTQYFHLCHFFFFFFLLEFCILLSGYFYAPLSKHKYPNNTIFHSFHLSDLYFLLKNITCKGNRYVPRRKQEFQTDACTPIIR